MERIFFSSVLKAVENHAGIFPPSVKKPPQPHGDASKHISAVWAVPWWTARSNLRSSLKLDSDSSSAIHASAGLICFSQIQPVVVAAVL